MAESFRKFGVTDDTRNLVAVKITDSDPEMFQRILDKHVQGHVVPCTAENLSKCSDEAFIRKVYKLPPPAQAGVDQGHQQQELELSILGLMAIRGAT